MTIIAKNHPKAAPNTNWGPKTPAGIGQESAKIVRVNFKRQNTKRLNATAGSAH